jgi:hypothetical protein
MQISESRLFPSSFAIWCPRSIAPQSHCHSPRGQAIRGQFEEEHMNASSTIRRRSHRYRSPGDGRTRAGPRSCRPESDVHASAMGDRLWRAHRLACHLLQPGRQLSGVHVPRDGGQRTRNVHQLHGCPRARPRRTSSDKPARAGSPRTTTAAVNNAVSGNVTKQGDCSHVVPCNSHRGSHRNGRHWFGITGPLGAAVLHSRIR